MINYFTPVLGTQAFSGFDPSYITPESYAPYRANPGQAPLSQMYNPRNFGAGQYLVGQDLPWSPFAAQSADYSRVAFLRSQATYRPSDTFMGGMQSVGVPLGAAYLASRIASANMTRVSVANPIYRSIGGLFAGEEGVKWSASAAMGNRVGSTVGRALLSPLDRLGVLGEGTAASVGEGIGGLVGAGAAVGWPFLLASMASKVANQAVFRPYGNIRALQNTIGQLSSGISFAGINGYANSGRGLGSIGSAELASYSDVLGASNSTFTQTSVNKILSHGIQEGLFNNVNSISQMKEKLKAVTKTVKFVMEIGNIAAGEATKLVANIQAGGASVRNGAAATFLKDMGISSSIAGTDMSQLYSTIGQQGSYFYQAAGLVPDVGAATAMKIYSGFSAAYRGGSMPNSLLASMGGVGGATQSALQGTVQLGQTTLASILAANRYMTGKGNGKLGMVSATTNYASWLAGNPLARSGEMALRGSMLTSKLLQSPHIVAKMVREQLRYVPTDLWQNKDGSIKEGAAMTALMGMGISERDARAMVYKNEADNSRGGIAQTIKGTGSYDILLHEKRMANDYQTFGGHLSFIPGVYKDFGGIVRKTGDMVKWWARDVSHPLDKWMNTFKYGEENTIAKEAIANRAKVVALGQTKEWEAGKSVILSERYKTPSSAHVSFMDSMLFLGGTPSFDKYASENKKLVAEISAKAEKDPAKYEHALRTLKSGTPKAIQALIWHLTGKSISTKQAEDLRKGIVSNQIRKSKAWYTSLSGHDSHKIYLENLKAEAGSEKAQHWLEHHAGLMKENRWVGVSHGLLTAADATKAGIAAFGRLSYDIHNHPNLITGARKAADLKEADHLFHKPFHHMRTLVDYIKKHKVHFGFEQHKGHFFDYGGNIQHDTTIGSMVKDVKDWFESSHKSKTGTLAGSVAQGLKEMHVNTPVVHLNAGTVHFGPGASKTERIRALNNFLPGGM